MAAGAGVGGVSQGPTPWWDLPENRGKRADLESQAPPGYTYDPVKMEYVHSPTQQGQAVNDYTKAANPALAGILGSISGAGAPGVSAASAGSAGGGAFGMPASVNAIAGGGQQVGGGGFVPDIAMPNSDAAASASFATAKDKAGKIARSSIDALAGELGAQNMLGSGAQVQGMRDIVSDAAGTIGQASRDTEMKRADLAADFAKTGYAGNITQRGQNINSQEANARLAQEERQMQQQALQFQQQQQMQKLQMILGSLSGGGAGSGLVY